MKLFGEYLVEKKLITNTLLAAALIEQLKSLPSIAEIVFEKKLLTTDQILTVFRTQVENNLSFVESANRAKLWNASVASKVNEHLASKRIPLGQILIKSGTVTLDQIINALDNFSAEYGAQKAKHPTASLESGSKESTSPTLAQNGKAEKLANFFDSLTPSLRGKLGLLFLPNSQTLNQVKAITNIRDEILSLKKIAASENRVKVTSLLENLEKLLDALLGLDHSSLKANTLKELHSIYHKSLEILWRYKELTPLDSKPGNESPLDKELGLIEDAIQILNFNLGFAVIIPKS